jgi:hypothetical protein
MVSHSPPEVRLPLLKKVAWESIQVGCQHHVEASACLVSPARPARDALH